MAKALSTSTNTVNILGHSPGFVKRGHFLKVNANTQVSMWHYQRRPGSPAPSATSRGGLQDTIMPKLLTQKTYTESGTVLYLYLFCFYLSFLFFFFFFWGGGGVMDVGERVKRGWGIQGCFLHI